MRTTRRFPKLVTLLCASALAFALGACGDDDDDDDTTCGAGTMLVNGMCVPIDYDATPGVIDAAIDAMPPQSTRSGLFALTNARVHGPPEVGNAVIANNGNILINYSALTAEADAAVAYDDRNALGEGCLVSTYNVSAGEAPADEVGEGDFTFSGDAIQFGGGTITCTFNADAGTFIDPSAEAEPNYECVHQSGDATAGSTWGFIDASSSSYTIPNDPDTFNLTVVGTALESTGSTTAAFDAARPVVGLLCADGVAPGGTGTCTTSDTIVVGGPVNPAAPLGIPTTAKYRLVVGTTGSALPGGADLLDVAEGGGTAITLSIDKAAGNMTEAVTTTLSAGGYDNSTTPATIWELDDASSQVYGLDLTGTGAETFSCDDTGGECGTSQVFVVFGTTTTAALPSPRSTSNFNTMPEPTNGTIASFRCAKLGAGDLVIPAEAMAVIRGTSPTRVETFILRGNLFQGGDSTGLNPLQGLAGAAYAGWTDR